MKTLKDAPPVLKLDPQDNLDSRSVIHLITRKFVTIGMMKIEDLQ